MHFTKKLEEQHVCKMLWYILSVCVFLLRPLTVLCENDLDFPKNFKFGVSTSAHQIEGAAYKGGKGEDIWSHFEHKQNSVIVDKSNADVACDSYRLYKRDVEMLRQLGVDQYRFSIAWSRILPTGFSNKINTEGVLYYNNLINELLKYNITPLVTMYHWDLPQNLQNLGGWANELIVDYFEDYARVLFNEFGDRVKNWITINEPYQICVFGYGYDFYSPGLNASGTVDYMCGNNVLLAHARAWHLYNETYRSKQKGRIGITLYSPWVEPESKAKEDLEIAERGMQFILGWQARPIFSTGGDYPDIFKKAIYNRSIEDGFKRSRLPELTLDQIKYLKGTSDFLGLNYYSSIMYRRKRSSYWWSSLKVPSRDRDFGYEGYYHSNWSETVAPMFKVHPIGFRYLLKWIKTEYNNPEVLITENGYVSKSGLYDVNRVSYINQMLIKVLEAIKEEGCNITSYNYWSLMDNYEWDYGYTLRFGLYDVNFKSPNKTRTPKMSAYVYKEIIRSKKVDLFFVPDMTLFKRNKSTAIIGNLGFIIFTLILHLLCFLKLF